MSLRINNNVESLNAHRHLINNDKQLSKSIERLSSGQKINRGADGPASLVISEGMRAQIGSLQQATDNNEAAISLVQTAEGALNEVSKLLVDMRQRAVSAANLGINDQNSVNASQKEIENALEAIDRISNNTQFGSKNLLDGSALDADGNPLVSFQIGANQGQIASVSLPNVATNQLAVGVSNDSGFSSLSDLDVTTGKGAEDAMGVIDKAIEEIAVARGDLGAFQKNTLESNLTSLRIASENMTAAESTIRDADMAVELAAFTRNQIMTQSATAQLAQANAMPKNVMALLGSQ
ncbi:MAG: flagellin [Proteobacteria bacterium]|nr:MAG: flagellin [Pseudomonadota bacterium]|tara:strand:+ start:136 stop:1017 length:882 start_codon:yes stop_codon:yes gene_type:complete